MGQADFWHPTGQKSSRNWGQIPVLANETTLKTRIADLMPPRTLLRSITWDQGTEMARHRAITRLLGAPAISPTHTRPAARLER
jgi:IS30 family transposase